MIGYKQLKDKLDEHIIYSNKNRQEFINELLKADFYLAVVAVGKLDKLGLELHGSVLANCPEEVADMMVKTLVVSQVKCLEQLQDDSRNNR